MIFDGAPIPPCPDCPDTPLLEGLMFFFAIMLVLFVVTIWRKGREYHQEQVRQRMAQINREAELRNAIDAAGRREWQPRS